MTNPKYYSAKDLEKHLSEEHKITPVSTYLREIVYGGADGIVTTFAVVSGFTGAQTGEHMISIPFLVVLLFGSANLLADGTSMALGNFLAVRSDKDVYKGEKEKEWQEIQNNPSMEKAETIEILQQKGFSKEHSARLTEIFSKNKKYWLEFMMKDELEIPNPEGENPVYTGLVTFLSFVIFGIIPLVPYYFIKVVGSAFVLSSLSALFALFMLGILRWRVTKTGFVRSVGETVLVGSIAGALAYFVGTFFRT